MSKTHNITISNQSSKIFIYNTTSTSEATEDDTKKSNESKSSSYRMEILTPDIRIKIDNSFNENNSEENEKLATNKSQEMMSLDHLNHKRDIFLVDEDVLMEDDGKFYLGTIINAKSGDYLIKFDDNTEKWSNYCKLKKFSASPSKGGDDLSLCVICKVSKEFDVVEVCDKCSRGYHRQCIKQHNTLSSPRWNCSRCSFDVISISDSEDVESISATDEINHKVTKFSYDVSSLLLSLLTSLFMLYLKEERLTC